MKECLCCSEILFGEGTRLGKVLSTDRWWQRKRQKPPSLACQDRCLGVQLVVGDRDRIEELQAEILPCMETLWG